MSLEFVGLAPSYDAPRFSFPFSFLSGCAYGWGERACFLLDMRILSTPFDSPLLLSLLLHFGAHQPSSINQARSTKLAQFVRFKPSSTMAPPGSVCII